MEFKSLYKFDILRKEKQKVKETKEENGQIITVEKEELVDVPTTFLIKKPSRAEKEEADIERAAHLAYCIQKGLITEALLSKTYANQGGVLTDEEHKRYAQLLFDLSAETKNFEEVNLEISKATEEEKRASFDKIMELRRKIIEFQNQQEQFFQSTAEAKAKVKFIEALTLMLTYYSVGGEKPKPFFPGDDCRDKYRALEKYENEDDELYYLVRDRLALLFSVLVASDGQVTEQEMRDIEKEGFGEETNKGD